MSTRILLSMGALGLAFALGACNQTGDAAVADSTRQAELAGADMIVYKSPYCGCCDLWIDHVEEHGFTTATVDVIEYDEQVAKKRELGVDLDLGSCHTAVIGGYVVEGHVPGDVIRRLLEEQPRIRGIAVPGMPIGSPGMEGPGARPYQVIAIARDGSRSLYEVVDPNAPAGDQ